MKLFRYGVCILLFCALFFLPQANEGYLFLVAVRRTADACLRALEEGSSPGKSTPPLHLVRLGTTDLPAGTASSAVEREIRRTVVMDHDRVYIGTDGIPWHKEEGQLRPLLAGGEAGPGEARAVEISVERTSRGGRMHLLRRDPPLEVTKTSEFITVTSLLPPFAAILLALLFQRTLLALFLGVWLGASLLEGGNPLAGLWRFGEHYLYHGALKDEFRLDILGFVFALCAAVGVMTRSGGIQGFVSLLVRLAKSVRSTQFVTYLMGIGIFFDDYANCIIVGNTLRPLTDRMRISREKLAYIVDSTAAPVAGLSMLSTWIAYEVSTFSAQLPEAGVREGAYLVFFQTLPYRFYCIFTLSFIGLQIFLRRDFGPMFKAERRARTTGAVIRPEGRPLVTGALTRIEAKPGAPPRWYNAALPIVVILLVTVEELWRTGGGWQRPLGDLLSAAAIREVLGNASDVNSARPIFVGASAGFLLAVLLARGQGILDLGECLRSALSSAKGLIFAVAILLLAWSIGGVCTDMGTAHYLIALFKGVIHPVIFPSVLFVTSCLVAFSTGSSWSTMSILLPNTVVLAVKIGEESGVGPLAMLVISIGAVLEGSIFGDHCSPLSDTTILSSVSSASDHLDHVKTQIPYACLTMATALLVGYVPAALGLHPALSIGTGIIFLFLFLLVVGRNPSRAAREDRVE